MFFKSTPIVFAALFCANSLPGYGNGIPEASDYSQVQKILNSKCVGCHNDTDMEGDVSLSSYARLKKGNDDGRYLEPGNVDESKLFQVISGGDPAMPPEDEEQLTPEETLAIRNWISSGASGPEDEMSITIPHLPSAKAGLWGAAILVGEDHLAQGTLGRVELRSREDDVLKWTLSDLPGKVNSLRVSNDRKTLIVGSGLAGVSGQVQMVDVSDGRVIKTFIGHSDTIYSAVLSPDGQLLASGSYDRTVIIWDVQTGEPVQELLGHNGAIYDLDFDPTGEVLATASADQTVKLWHVASGKRLDTLGQPEGEMRCVRFDSRGESVFAAGADRQIRQWSLVSKNKPAINPMIHSRFAHESEVLYISVAQGVLLSAAADLTVKAWSEQALEPLGTLATLVDVPVSVGRIPGDGRRAVVVELNGSRREISLPERQQSTVARSADSASGAVSNSEKATNTKDEQPASFADLEPNDAPRTAGKITLPATVNGVIEGVDSQVADVDLYRFSAIAGEKWIFEVKAARNGSKLDSWISILHTAGAPVLQTRLQAVRESYFTFRGKDSSTSDDFRLHKWEDMELDEFLYASGEVSRLWLYPRGPDSGFKVYPGFGSRYAFFGSTPVSHALGEPAYVVRELKKDETVLPNGLPVFPLYFENDDDPLRRNGADSRLIFIAPETGEYLVRIRDARSFQGPEFSYQLQVRRPKPSFQIKVTGNKMEMPVGSGREWKVQATRLDGMTAPIEVYLHGVPEGFEATNPLIIEAEQETALGTIFASADATLPAIVAPNTADESKAEFVTVVVGLTAKATFEGRPIEQKLSERIELTLNKKKEVQLRMLQVDGSREIDALSIRAGETISALVIADRNGSKNRLSFGKDDSGRNLPHGAYVDNIGLNGLLIPEKQTQREFFITAAPKVKPGRRQFHLRLETDGNSTSRPIWINVTD